MYFNNRLSSSNGTHYYGPVAVRFEYDINHLPTNLRSAIFGTPTHGKVASVLKTFIQNGSFSTDRVGYFLNLGNATPSNSHSSKFLGNYY